jgi:AcrR family transcriptional regulator
MEAIRVGTWETLSLRELSRSVGVTATAAYRHFRSKEELLESLAVQGLAELRDSLRGAAAGVAGRTALEKVAGAYRDFAQHNVNLMSLMFRPRIKGRGTRAKLDGAMGECLAEFVAAVTLGGSGDDPERAIRLATQAWSAVHGFALLSEAGAFAALDPWMLPTTSDLMSGAARPSR